MSLSNISVGQESVAIIPKPVLSVSSNGQFVLSDRASIIHDNLTKATANFLKKSLKEDLDITLSLSKRKKSGIHLSLNTDLVEEEGYLLKITDRGIDVSARTEAGLFYGVQSLRQMILFGERNGNQVTLKATTIEDYPRFGWRAFMLDESRHFKGGDQVKKLLDQMALLKMNVFHWHLTDDQGWRIEIKKYPKLTEVGAFRSDTQVGGWNSEKRSNESHGGFYTQKQIKEIVAYATARHITVIPEIEMPGHASAAIAAYPWLGTSGESIDVPVVFGKMPDSYKVTDQRVLTFLHHVLDEVMTLFPSEIIHIGGDEVKYDQWKESTDVQAFMNKNDLSSPADLQIYFTNQISQYLDSKEKRMMGWNEILGHNVHAYQKSEDTEVKEELAVSSIIHFWKGELKLAKTALEKGYDIVNSLHSKTYLDYGYKNISVQAAYEFDPIPEGLETKYHSQVLGTGAQMWGEWIPTVERMDFQVFPRLAAYAEVGWTQLKQKDFDHFDFVLTKLKNYWSQKGIAYGKE
ncbi:beta-N-acetylhexosaminidase [Roseivirga sp. E12]|uniref:beta-N-acetylhexosaminidase n=1 Tax=Roseivirga sp. E12 TaxID=2819237 RepID=UPI001ABC84F1|nr:beta-N-acetylhexosaminidase [Roseivirga sp. E12]MBO3699917.1 beta-N-acetylhexosaminidase [Roseivirga sp. E12]